MAMEQMPPDAAPQEQGGAEGGPGQMQQMISTVGQALDQLATVISQQMPEVGDQFMQVSDAFKGAVQSLLESAQGGGRQAAQAPVDAQAGAGQVRQAY